MFDAPIVAIVGPNGSGKSNCAEAFRWVLGEQSMKSLRGKRGEDLIFNGSSSMSRLNRASVALTFDNSNRAFKNVDFDEVTVSRSIFRDGLNEYAVNGSKVRLKDIIELLANVSLGASGHHIISQGEADRILNANLADRRAMIEDALGLKIYQWKLAESERKLAKTKDNIKEAETLRREIAPHLKFLKKQVEKVEKANELRADLVEQYREYLKREQIYLSHWEEKLARDLAEPKRQLTEIEGRSSALGGQPKPSENIDEQNEAREIEAVLKKARNEKDKLTRRLGRLEGVLELAPKEASSEEVVSIPGGEFAKMETNLNDIFSRGEMAEGETLRNIFLELKNTLAGFWSKYRANVRERKSEVGELENLAKEKVEVLRALGEIEQEENRLNEKLSEAKMSAVRREKEAREADRAYYEMKAKKTELSARITLLESRQNALAIEVANFKQELAEAAVLVGREAMAYESYEIATEIVLGEARTEQEKRQREIERLKIKLEDSGDGGGDVLKEFEQVSSRDVYLAKELDDLARSAESLEQVMDELREKIDSEFSVGLQKTNAEFQKFFEMLFGGGSASLSVIKPRREVLPMADDDSETASIISLEMEKETAAGIDINVSLPRKKIKGLAMLSGGERALTAIALIFAMSQVNPPPFLILDETDAALDEANSRKYGDMIENLSKYSQLILITHNRETMSRAGILYGVTMGSDSMSRLISIKLEEAEAYAK